jgi:hypothetical protein
MMRIAAVGEAVMMPIGSDVGWQNEKFAMGRQYENAAEHNHQQSLQWLAERGGLVWSEAAAIVEMRPWFSMDATNAERIVREALISETPHADQQRSRG